ncbi:MAG: hypothetical protein V4471_06510 [Pseudomonadota bacterium]
MHNKKINSFSKKKIAIIGSGWYGVHIALVLKKECPSCKVTLFEKNSDIFSETSGKFGIRLHSGLHYPRSEATRIACYKGFNSFFHYYPELIRPHLYSVYGLGIRDANGNPSKVDKEKFASVCKEFESSKEIQPDEWGYNNLSFAVDVGEPSLVLGKPLRDFFMKKLEEAGVRLLCEFGVVKVKKRIDNKLVVSGKSWKIGNDQFVFNYVVNTTSYQTLVPDPRGLPLKMEIVYQPCLALMYEYTERPLPNLPFSFIVMDGWFPCLMPYDDRANKQEIFSKYIMTHGKWTIMGSYKTAAEAKNHLHSIDDDFIDQQVKPNCEKEMERFWPGFKQKFIYIGWIGALLAKVKTDKEFRSAVIFQNKENKMIYVVPGKVSNIFDAGEEVLSLVGLDKKKVIRDGNYRYVEGGSLFTAKYEITEKPKDSLQNTCELQPYREREIEQVKKAESPGPGFFKSLGKHFISSHQNLSKKINCYP